MCKQLRIKCISNYGEQHPTADNTILAMLTNLWKYIINPQFVLFIRIWQCKLPMESSTYLSPWLHH